ncbi:MAG: ABC transporter ATP-binding protein [Pseudomonadota bacterium]
MADPVLEIAGLSKRYGALTATDDLSLTLRPGEIHALIGPNGAGKSTLIGQIAGAIRPDAGTIRIMGHDVTPRSIAARARLGLGRSFQISALASDLSVLAHVRIAAQAREGGAFRFWAPVRWDADLREAAMTALARVGLADRADATVGALSHGERRQLEVACALALHPRLLLLDEPMAGLGLEGTEAMTRFLADLKHEMPILLVEHDMDAVFELADRVSVLLYGRIIASGTVEEIRADAAVREAYLGEAH